MNVTEMHAHLVDAGWRVDINGYWVSPFPETARLAYRSIESAWAAHLAAAFPEDAPT